MRLWFFLIIYRLSVFGVEGQSFKCQWAVPLNHIKAPGKILQDHKGNIIYYSQSLAKVDTLGKHVWTIPFPHHEALIEGAAVDSQSNIYISGTFKNELKINEQKLNSFGGTDIFLAKINPDGEINWLRQAGGEGNDLGGGLLLHKNTLYITGSFRQNPQFGEGDSIRIVPVDKRSRPYIAHFNLRGEFLQIKYWDTQPTIYDTTYSFIKNIMPHLDSKGNFYMMWHMCRITTYLNDQDSIVAPFHSGRYSYHLVKMSPDNTYSSIYLGTDSEKVGVHSFNIDPNLNVFVASYSSSQYSGSGNIILMLDTSLGKIKEIRPPFYKALNQCSYTHSSINEIKCDAPSNLLLLGANACTDYQAREAESHTLIQKMDTSGNISELRSYRFAFFSDEVVIINTIEDRASPTFYSLGYTTKKGYKFENDSIPPETYFISKFVDSTSFVSYSNINNIRSEKFNIYPNPTNGVLSVRIKPDTEPRISIRNICVRDVLGKVICSKAFDRALLNDAEISLGENAKGIYFVEVLTDKGKQVAKVVLQ